MRPKLGLGPRPWLASRATKLILRSMLPHSACAASSPNCQPSAPTTDLSTRNSLGQAARSNSAAVLERSPRLPWHCHLCADVTRVAPQPCPAKYKTAQAECPHEPRHRPTCRPWDWVTLKVSLSVNAAPKVHWGARRSPETGMEGDKPMGSPHPGAGLRSAEFTGLEEIPAILRIRKTDHPFPLLSCKRHSDYFPCALVCPGR